MSLELNCSWMHQLHWQNERSACWTRNHQLQTWKHPTRTSWSLPHILHSDAGVLRRLMRIKWVRRRPLLVWSLPDCYACQRNGARPSDNLLAWNIWSEQKLQHILHLLLSCALDHYCFVLNHHHSTCRRLDFPSRWPHHYRSRHPIFHHVHVVECEVLPHHVEVCSSHFTHWHWPLGLQLRPGRFGRWRSRFRNVWFLSRHFTL